AWCAQSIRRGGGPAHGCKEEPVCYICSMARLRNICLFLALALSSFGASDFREHLVATGLSGGYQVVVADMNHDGKPDLIALASGLHELVWFENPGWQRHVIIGGIRAPINVTV